ncbi:MAG: ribosome small subunit-dependent GTPase A [Acidimicrobiia bacterium]|nr:ribosome small subunit-dependent GTPase A [Acidimicrobiia bacterium]MBP8179913.1 ribosome small subunit-dependent GTPase A [Acidimicrobiia bacterium]
MPNARSIIPDPLPYCDAVHAPGLLTDYGWDADWALRANAAITGEPALASGDPADGDEVCVGSVGFRGHTVGRVTRQDRGWVSVITDDGPVRVLSNEAVAGDWVFCDADQVTHLLARKSALVRHSERRVDDNQVLAANMDYVSIVVGLDKAVNARRLERFLVMAWESDAEPLVVLNKADVVDDIDQVVDQVLKLSPDVDVIPVSAERGSGLEGLRQRLDGSHKTMALVGESGVGKSTICNSLLGSEIQSTQSVRIGDSKGRHTTTTRELLLLPFGGVLLDTPGVRSVGLWGASVGVERAFSDLFGLSEDCKFRDCSHDGAPECAVAAAVAAGDIAAERVDAWGRIVSEMDAAAQRFGAWDQRPQRRPR